MYLLILCLSMYVGEIKQFKLSDKHLYPLIYLADLVLVVCI